MKNLRVEKYEGRWALVCDRGLVALFEAGYEQTREQDAANVAARLTALDAVARWWEQGGHSISPNMVPGDSDSTIRRMVEDATGITR